MKGMDTRGTRAPAGGIKKAEVVKYLKQKKP
jgi:hypothetical protein